MSEGGNVRHAFPGYRVFIFGMEVTEDVIDVNVQQHDGKVPNTANITIVSPRNRYFITDFDIAKIKDIALTKLKATVPNGMVRPGSTWYQPPSVDGPNGPEGDGQPAFKNADPIKQQILAVKTSVPPIKAEVEPVPGSYIDPQAAERYPFQSGKPIFHPMDSVRVFRRDEFQPSNWHHWFTGVVSDFTDSYGMNQERELRITAEDPSKALRLARFTTNPGLVDIEQQIVRNAIINDVASLSVFASMFEGRSLPEIMCAMLFGERAFSVIYDESLNTAKYRLRHRRRASMRGAPFPTVPSQVPTGTPRLQLDHNKLSDDDARRFAREAGFTGDEVDIAVALAYAESSMRPRIVLDHFTPYGGKGKTQERWVDDPEPDGIIDTMYGLFQIAENHWFADGKPFEGKDPETACDPAQAFKYAYYIKNQSSLGWRNWEAFYKIDTKPGPNQGKPMYQKYLPTMMAETIAQRVGIEQAAFITKQVNTISSTRDFIVPRALDDDARDWCTDTIYGAWGSARVGRRLWGIGHTNFNRSRAFLYNTTESDGIPAGLNIVSANSDALEGMPMLEAYQASLDTLVTEEDLSDLVAEFPVEINRLDDTLDANPTIDDIIYEIGSHPEWYPVDGGRLMMLLPPGVTGSNKEIVTHDLVQTFQLNTEWNTRAQIVYDMLERIEFVFYVTPRGDYCVEFPLYDFDPEDFGDYGESYVVTKSETCGIESGFSDGKILTQMTIAPQLIQNWSFSENISKVINRKTVTLWHLIPMFGVRSVPVTSKGYISTVEAGVMYANIALNRTNADCYTQRVVVTPNIYFWINRPVLIDALSHIGTIKSVKHHIRWGMQGSVDTEIGLNAMRGWDGTLTKPGPEGKRVYTPIGGNASRPLNYKILFNQNKQADNTTVVKNKWNYSKPSGIPG